MFSEEIEKDFEENYKDDIEAQCEYIQYHLLNAFVTRHLNHIQYAKESLDELRLQIIAIENLIK